MSDFIRTGSGFTKALALGSVQHGAVIESSLLPPTIGISEPMVSLAAGKWGVPKHCLKWEVVPDKAVCWETQINYSFFGCRFASLFYRIYEKLGKRYIYFPSWIFHLNWKNKWGKKYHLSICILSPSRTYSKSFGWWFQGKVRHYLIRFFSGFFL